MKEISLCERQPQLGGNRTLVDVPVLRNVALVVIDSLPLPHNRMIKRRTLFATQRSGISEGDAACALAFALKLFRDYQADSTTSMDCSASTDDEDIVSNDEVATRLAGFRLVSVEALKSLLSIAAGFTDCGNDLCPKEVKRD